MFYGGMPFLSPTQTLSAVQELCTFLAWTVCFTVIVTGIHIISVGIANREDPDQTVSSEAPYQGLPCLSMAFWQASSVQNFWQSWSFY